MKDARDLAVSTSSAQALEHFETALTQFHSYTGDPLATMQQALAGPRICTGAPVQRVCDVHGEREALPAGGTRVDRQATRRL